MLEKMKGIRLKGGNFVNETQLDLFSGSADKVAKMAMVYGRNGSGKTTVSNAFKKLNGEYVSNIEMASIYDNNAQEIPIFGDGDKKVFVYNEDFVNDKVKIQEEGLGSIIMLGEKADLTVKIEQAMSRFLEAKENYNRIKDRMEEYKDNKNPKSPEFYINKMCEILKNDDGWAGRERKIKDSRRNANVSRKKYLDFINQTVSKSRADLRSDFEKEMQELNKAKQGSGKITEEIIKISDIYKNFNCNNVNELLRKPIERPDLSKRERYLLDLIKTEEKGFLQKQIEYFSNSKNTYCPFCLQDVSVDYKTNLVEKIQSILSDAVKEHCGKLSKYLIEEIHFDFTPFTELKSCKSSFELLNKINKVIQDNNNIINRKINFPYDCVNEEVIDMNELVIKLEASLIVLEEEKIKYNENINNTTPIIERLVCINNELAYWEIIDDYNQYLSQSNEYNSLSNEENSAFKLVEDRELLCKDLENQRKNIKIAVDLINRALKYIFFSKERLKIVAENDKYKVLSNGKPVLPNNISVGERNIIGLCYFFASILQGKDNKDAFREECLIIIDDPVSSFDFENKVGILSFLKLMLSQILNANLNSKAVIFTHDLLTFFDMEKVFEELQAEFKISHNNIKTIFSLFELKECSLIDFRYKNRHEYTELMKMTYDYAIKKSSDSSILIGNVMRQVLEAFSTFEFKKGISEVSTDSSILSKLDVEYQEYFRNLMYRLILHGRSHRGEETRSGKLDFFTVISDEEKVRTAKDILCFVYLLNDLHVIAHLGNVSEELNKWCSEIKNK